MRISIAARMEWLRTRKRYDMASEAAAILEISPWTTKVQLYDEKISSEVIEKHGPQLEHGHRMEDPMRRIAMLELPYFRWEYHEFDILVSDRHPFMGATLDGELTVIDPMNPWGFPVGTKGIYEGKTGSWKVEKNLYAWNGADSYIPDYYYAQGLHQLECANAQFVIFQARLKRDPYRDIDNGLPDIRTFYRIIDRRIPAVQADIEYLIEKEEEFRNNHLIPHIRPQVVLKAI